MFMLGFPLLVIPFAIYNIIAFLIPGVTWTGVVSTVHMVSGADWTMSAGDMLVTLAIVLLCGEVIKSTRIGFRTVVAHALSLILFLVGPTRPYGRRRRALIVITPMAPGQNVSADYLSNIWQSDCCTN
jgi:hypothetical protein